MKIILSKIYLVWVILVFSFFMLLLLPGMIFPSFFGSKAVSITYFFLSLWARIFSRLTFIRYEIIGREKITKGKTYIYISNHTSLLDLPGITLTIPGQYRPLAKKELLNVPIFGWIAKATCVVVDRRSTESRKKSIGYLKQILNYGVSILIFPEGTQNRTKDTILPFKEGAFKIALDTGKPIQPLAVIGASALMPPGRFMIKPGVIKVVVGEAISVAELDPDQASYLKDNAYQALQEMIKRNS